MSYKVPDVAVRFNLYILPSEYCVSVRDNTGTVSFFSSSLDFTWKATIGCGFGASDLGFTQSFTEQFDLPELSTERLMVIYQVTGVYCT